MALARTDRPADVLAGATPYLRMLSLVTGGWLDGPGASAARSLLAAPGRGSYDEALLRGRIASAEFFLGQLLPTAMGLLPSVTAGVAALDPVGLG